MNFYNMRLSLSAVVLAVLPLNIPQGWANERANAMPDSAAAAGSQQGVVDPVKFRGVVYDVGLQFTPGTYSVETYNADLVKYDMRAIATELHANTVRIEGEDLTRLVAAARVAHEAGLKVFFNPWKMGVDADETATYMEAAAVEAEKLRNEGLDIVFVSGCEYTLFNKGAFPGDTLNDRIAVLVSAATKSAETKQAAPEFVSASKYLNEVLGRVVKGVRSRFNGPVTYASGSWEGVDWGIFDIVGVDHYRNGEPEADYVAALDRYRLGKPLIVMEVGSCAYEGAAARGAGGFMILQGTNPDGTLKYEGGKPPVRSESEQAGYVETQVRVLSRSKVDGVFIYVFAFPSYPYDEKGADMDMTSFALVKSYPKHDPRSKNVPSWERKEAFGRLARLYQQMDK